MENKRKYPNLCFYAFGGLFISFIFYFLLHEINKVLEINYSGLFNFISIVIITLSLISVMATIVSSRLDLFSKDQDKEEILDNFRKFLRVTIMMIMGVLILSAILIFLPKDVSIQIEGFGYLVLFALIFLFSFFIYFFTAVFSFIDNYRGSDENHGSDLNNNSLSN
jgi:uncharacterized membrane protein YraQ (UPF0718 family)